MTGLRWKGCSGILLVLAVGLLTLALPTPSPAFASKVTRLVFTGTLDHVINPCAQGPTDIFLEGRVQILLNGNGVHITDNLAGFDRISGNRYKLLQHFNAQDVTVNSDGTITGKFNQVLISLGKDPNAGFRGEFLADPGSGFIRFGDFEFYCPGDRASKQRGKNARR
jgi:hypothetical protein